MSGGATPVADTQPCPGCGRRLSRRAYELVEDGECLFCREGDNE